MRMTIAYNVRQTKPVFNDDASQFALFSYATTNSPVRIGQEAHISAVAVMMITMLRGVRLIECAHDQFSTVCVRNRRRNCVQRTDASERPGSHRRCMRLVQIKELTSHMRPARRIDGDGRTITFDWVTKTNFLAAQDR